MELSISIPESLAAKIEKERRFLKMTRSEFVKKALRYYLEHGLEEETIRRINKVCEEVDTSLDPGLRRYVSEAMSKVEWEDQ